MDGRRLDCGIHDYDKFSGGGERPVGGRRYPIVLVEQFPMLRAQIWMQVGVSL
jgi:hypothetical protein